MSKICQEFLELKDEMLSNYSKYGMKILVRSDYKLSKVNNLYVFEISYKRSIIGASDIMNVHMLIIPNGTKSITFTLSYDDNLKNHEIFNRIFSSVKLL